MLKKLMLNAFLGFVNIICIVSGEYYDITTVHKFNTVYKLDENGDILTTYLNTCEVAVHTQTNAVGLPFFNMENINSTQPNKIVYPLKTPSIPRLEHPLEESQYTTLADADEKPLKGNEDIFTLLEHGNVLLEKWAMDHQIINIIDTKEMARFNEKANVFLHVEVPLKYNKDFQFCLRKTNGDYIWIKVSDIYGLNNLIKVCPGWISDCQEYVYQSNEKSQISIYINLKGDIKVYDAIAQKIWSSDKTKGFTANYSYIERDNLYNAKYTYKIVQIKEKKIKKIDVFTLLERGNVLLEKWAMDHDIINIIDTKEMASFNEKTNVFLQVDVPLKYPKDFEFCLRKTDGTYIWIKVYEKNNLIKLCPGWIADCEEYVYQSNKESQISIYINLKGDIKVYDAIAQKIWSSDKTKGFTANYSYIERDGLYHAKYTYKIVQITDSIPLDAVADDTTIATPWFNNSHPSSSLFITYYRKIGKQLQAELRTENVSDTIHLELEQNVIKLKNLPGMFQNETYEMVVTKIDLRFPEKLKSPKYIWIHAPKDVFIWSIWEGNESEQTYKIHESKPCVRESITEIYKVALEEPRHAEHVVKCYNGGFPDDYKESCICPPGFTGDACEISCGRHYYGKECSNMCSDAGTDCKGMVLCTPGYGCSCAPGYHGNQCLEQCSEGTYGADCMETCGQCKDGCDKYTGYCVGECDSPHLVWPYCKELHTYWTEYPEIIHSNFTSVTLRLNFSMSHIVNSSDVTQFYKVQYKEDKDTVWRNSTLNHFSPIVTEHEVKHLSPGKKYLFRAILIDNVLRESDPTLSKISESVTECKVSEIKNKLNVNKVTSNSISLTWEKETMKVDDTQCAFQSYSLDIDELMDGSVKHSTIVDIKRNNVILKSLAPGKIYNITLNRTTIDGKSSAVSNLTVSTETGINNSMDIRGTTLKKVGSQIKVQWFRNSLYKTYYIKYKLKKYLSCNNEEFQSPLQVVSTSFTNYTLNLKPEALYEIFVTGDPTQSSCENRTIVTDGKLPDISPSFLKQKFRVTNETAHIYWMDLPQSCNQMNGMFEKYVVELLDNGTNLLKTYETQDREMEITELTPRTSYKVRIRYVNNVGFNSQIYEQQYFTTKATSFLTAQDLTAYKTSADMIGIRFKMPDTNSTITGINVKVQNHAINKSMNLTDPTSIQCNAWPSHVCYDITQLKQNTKYTVSVEIFSEEFPEGGSQKFIQAVTREFVPAPVSDIKEVDISSTNVTISWRIPFLLNGILSKFLIEVEHLSSFDESKCCQPISTINYEVTKEEEIYYHVLENLLNASSYQITVRAFTKRRGQEATKIVNIPPTILPLRIKPRVIINTEEIVWKDLHMMSDTSPDKELTSDVLVIVLPESYENNTKYTNVSTPYQNELSHHLKSNDWWLATVCSEDCTVNIGDGEKSNSPYGEVNNKPLTQGKKYTIVLAQVNKYLSARSYTIVKSAQFQMGESLTASTVETRVDATPKYSTTDRMNTLLPTGETFEGNDIDKNVDKRDQDLPSVTDYEDYPEEGEDNADK